MTEKEKRILEKFVLLMPKLSDSDRSYLIGMGEGMAIKARQEQGSGRLPEQDGDRRMAV